MVRYLLTTAHPFDIPILSSLTTDHPKNRTHYSQFINVAAVANIADAKS